MFRFSIGIVWLECSLMVRLTGVQSQVVIPIVKLLVYNDHGRNGISNFFLVKIFNTDLKILAKVSKNYLPTLLISLTAPEQTCAMRDNDIPNNQLLRPIFEKINYETTLINLDLLIVINRELTIVSCGLSSLWPLSNRIFAAGSPSYMCFHEGMVKVIRVSSEPFVSWRLIRQGCSWLPILYSCIRTFPTQVQGESDLTRNVF